MKMAWKRVVTINLVSIHLCTDHVNITNKSIPPCHRINTRKFPKQKCLLGKWLEYFMFLHHAECLCPNKVVAAAAAIDRNEGRERER